MNFWNQHFHPYKSIESSELQPALSAILTKIYKLWQAAGILLILLP